ncbi:MAG: peptidoglycan editing factor PgeF [Pseudomonadota bacterium]
MQHYKSEKLEKYSWLAHGFGTKGFTLNDYLNHLGVHKAKVAQTNQVHGNGVHVLDGTEVKMLAGDGFITNQTNVVCFIRTADCVPILLCDPEHKAVAAVHAGWRGCAGNVMRVALDKMYEHFHSNPANVKAAIGPAVCEGCYSVGEDVRQIFVQSGLSENNFKRATQSEKYYLDLKAAVRERLLKVGLRKENVETLSACTSCNPEHFVSYRQDPNTSARQVNFILIK